MNKILRNGKWDGIWDRPKYQEMRERILDEFKDLLFEEGPHKYYLHGKEITCVSNVTHMFQEHFDTERKAQETYENNYDKPESKYFHMTPEEIKKEWEEISRKACEHGTERHEFGESCFYYMTGQYDKILPDFKERLTEDNGFEAIHPKEIAAAQFYEDLPICFVPILAETKVYREDLRYSGTFDLLCYYDATLEGKDDRNSGLVVLDWKTNKDLYKNFNGKKLLTPFDGLLDMPLSIYKLQLSLYSLALEHIGMKVVGRRIMWLRPDGTYNKIPLESYTKELEKALQKLSLI